MITITPRAEEQILKSAQQAGLKEACPAPGGAPG